MAFETVTGYCWPQSVDGRRHRRAAPVLGRRAAGGRRGGPRSARERDGRVLRRRRPGRQPPHARRTPHRHGLRLAGRARARRRPGVALRLLRGRPRDRRRRQAPPQPRLLRGPPAGRRARPRRSCSRWRPTPGTPTTTSAAATSTPAAPTSRSSGRCRPGYLYKPPGVGRRVTDHRAARPADGRPRRLPRAQPPLALRRLGRVARLGAAVPAVGRAARATPSTSSPTPTSRTTPTLLLRRRLLALPVGRPRRVLVGRHARHGRGLHRPGRQRRLPLRQHRRSGRCAWRTPTPEGPAATMVGYKGFFKQDPVFGTDRVGELTSIWSDHLIERPENHMTGVSFARGGYHRIGKRATAGAGGYTIHRPDHWLFEGTGLGYGDLLGAGATTVGYECDGCDFTYRDGLPYPTGVDGTPRDFEILGTAPAAHFTRTTATRPPAPERAVRGRVHRRPPVRRQPRPRRTSSASPTATPCSAPTRRPAGGVVVTSGSTDWAHGLAGRDPQVEQITRNLLDRLGALSLSSRSASSAAQEREVAVGLQHAPLDVAQVADALACGRPRRGRRGRPARSAAPPAPPRRGAPRPRARPPAPPGARPAHGDGAREHRQQRHRGDGQHGARDRHVLEREALLDQVAHDDDAPRGRRR